MATMARLRERVKDRIDDGLEDAEAWVSYFGNYVSRHGQQALLRHKYAARDDSLVLKYITDPLYCKWVTYFPTWLPPNIITLLGLSFSSLGHLLLAFQCPSLEGPIPVWMGLYNAIAILAYQAFDAMDGKQARRTGSGSPLGMLFDHGCDALNTTVLAISLACALQLGPTPWALLLAGIAWVGFFTATLEEYYTGELYLGYLNLPNEGLQIMAVVHLLAPFLTPEWWRTPCVLGLQRNHLAVVVSSVMALATMAYNVGVITLWVQRKRASEQARVGIRQSSPRPRLTAAERYESSLLVFAYRCLPPAFVLWAFVYWALLSPSEILIRRPRLLLWTIGISNAKLVTGIMLAHVCDEAYHPFSRTIACLCTLLVHVCIQLHWRHSSGGGAVPAWDVQLEDLLLTEAFALLLASYLHMIYAMIHEVSRALGIYAFTITRKREKHAAD